MFDKFYLNLRCLIQRKNNREEYQIRKTTYPKEL